MVIMNQSDADNVMALIGAISILSLGLLGGAIVLGGLWILS
jgi:hypothetical protein